MFSSVVDPTSFCIVRSNFLIHSVIIFANGRRYIVQFRPDRALYGLYPAAGCGVDRYAMDAFMWQSCLVFHRCVLSAQFCFAILWYHLLLRLLEGTLELFCHAQIPYLQQIPWHLLKWMDNCCRILLSLIFLFCKYCFYYSFACHLEWRWYCLLHIKKRESVSMATRL